MKRTAGILALVLITAAPVIAQQRRRGQQGQVPVTVEAMEKLGDLLKRDWGESGNPEWTQMAASILKGRDLDGIGNGWYKPSQTRHDWKWLRAEFDTNPRDGEVERQELPKSVTDVMFKRLDRDMDGAITSRDLMWSKNHIMDIYNPANEVFQQVDLDSNGRLSKAEMSKFFERYADGFDYLTPDDLKKALKFSKPPPANMAQLRSTMRLPAPQRWQFFNLLINEQLGVLEPGPDVGADAPDFRLPVLVKDKENHELKLSKERIQLSDSKGKKPVVLIFGSFT